MRCMNLKSTVNVVDSFGFDRLNSLLGSGVADFLRSHFLPLLRSYVRAQRQTGAPQHQVVLAGVAVTTGRGATRPATATMPAITTGRMWPATG